MKRFLFHICILMFLFNFFIFLYFSFSSTETTVEDEKKLPQTGQLWWPVGILLSAGAVLLAAGLVMKKRSKEK